MGLESLVNKQGYVHSNKSVDSIHFSKHAWMVAIQYNPELTYTLVTRENPLDNETVKLFIELIDEILLKDGGEGKVSDTQIENLEHWREELLELIE